MVLVVIWKFSQTIQQNYWKNSNLGGGIENGDKT
jgi:hypothetical protein